MSISSDGQICFGIALDESEEYPWDDDFERWWFDEVCGYVEPFPLFTEDGGYINPEDQGDQAKTGRYFAHQRTFAEQHPCPVRLDMHCSYEYPMWILAVGPKLRAWRGTPVSFEKGDLHVSMADYDALLAFCETHGVQYEGEPTWWLSSLYG